LLDPYTFPTTLYVMANDIAKLSLSAPATRGTLRLLSADELITPALFSQWMHLPPERAFYFFPPRHLRPAFPAFPSLLQFNRLLRDHQASAEFCLHMAAHLGVHNAVYKALGGTTVVTRDRKRRGWLFGQTDLSYSTRRVWFEVLRLLLSVSAEVIISGYGFAPPAPKISPWPRSF
jgi:hypothetical protein